MSRRSTALAAAAVALASVAAFVAGGALAGIASPAAVEQRWAAVERAPEAIDAPRPRRAAADPRAGLEQLGHALAAAVHPPPAAAAAAHAYVETPEQRADRHRVIHAKLTATLGPLSAQKRAELIELNDEATDVQLGLQAALLAGSLSQADYDTQLHQRVVVQLDQLRAIVTDDEYRRLTGLEPGVDPYEFMRTGVGGAEEPAPTLAATDSPR